MRIYKVQKRVIGKKVIYITVGTTPIKEQAEEAVKILHLKGIGARVQEECR